MGYFYENKIQKSFWRFHIWLHTTAKTAMFLLQTMKSRQVVTVSRNKFRIRQASHLNVEIIRNLPWKWKVITESYNLPGLGLGLNGIQTHSQSQFDDNWYKTERALPVWPGSFSARNCKQMLVVLELILYFQKLFTFKYKTQYLPKLYILMHFLLGLVYLKQAEVL